MATGGPGGRREPPSEWLPPLALRRAPDRGRGPTPLTAGELRQFLGAQRGWRHEGSALVRDFRFHDFDEGLRFVEYVAQRAVDYLRRPDACISSGQVRLSISNRHGAGITLAELRLAAKVNAAVADLQADRRR